MTGASSGEKWAVCNCNTCSGHLEFERDNVGETVVCPHCGMETTLYVPDSNLSPRPVPVRLPELSLGPVSPVLTEEHVYFANNKLWSACPVTVHRGILEVADGRKIATRAITSKEIVSLPYCTKVSVVRDLTTSQKVLRVVGWVLCVLLPFALVAVGRHSNESAESQSAPTFAEMASFITLAGPVLLFVTRKRQTVQRTGTLHHLMVTYPGCDQYIQTASSLVAAYGSHLGLGVIGTSGKLTSGDIILSSTDREAVARLSEDIEKVLREAPRA
jgi:hypothetical protein